MSPSLLFEPTTQQASVLAHTGSRLLVDGPPGSGKTTVAALAAGRMTKHLLQDQRVLFLTFTNNATDRIAQAIHTQLPSSERRAIQVSNYHSLFFRLIVSWSRWVGLPAEIELMTDAEHRELYTDALGVAREQGLNVRVQRRGVPSWFSKVLALHDGILGDVRAANKPVIDLASAAKKQINQLGRLHFDDFEYYALRILESQIILSAYSRRYPVVFVDEFQDITDLQYFFLERLCKSSTWYAFGDSEQAIYLWAGASPTRLGDFESSQKAPRITLPKAHRFGSGSGIDQMANGLRQMASMAHESWQRKRINAPDVAFQPCQSRSHQFSYATKVLPRMRAETGSIVCMVPTNAEAKELSAQLSKSKIMHTVLLDEQEESLWEDVLALFVTSKDVARVAQALDYASGGLTFRTEAGQREVEQLIASLPNDSEMNRLEASAAALTGIIGVNEALERSGRYVKRLLLEPHRGGLMRMLQSKRAQLAFTGRSSSAKGIAVMTMHKTKGKEFDTAVLFAPEKGRFLGGSLPVGEEARQDLLAWHTAVARGRNRLQIYYTQTLISPYLDPFL